MPAKSIPDRLDDCEKFQESQQTDLQKHSERIRELESNVKNLLDLEKRIAVLEEDLKIVVKYSGQLQHAIINAASGPGLDDVKRFRDKYQIRIG
jgi:hypothetical protein